MEMISPPRCALREIVLLLILGIPIWGQPLKLLNGSMDPGGLPPGLAASLQQMGGRMTSADEAQVARVSTIADGNGTCVRYQFNCGDGTLSPPLAVRTTTASHTWTSAGPYTVIVQAHSAIDITITSNLSSSLNVTIDQ